MSINPHDPEVRTPNHFLLLRGNPTNNLGVPSIPPPRNSKKRYQLAKQLITHFCDRWTREYVPNLIERQRWVKKRCNHTISDIILAISPNMSRGQRPLGRVTAVFPGQHGIARSADVAVFKAKSTQHSTGPTSLCTLLPSISPHAMSLRRGKRSRCFFRNKGRQCSGRIKSHNLTTSLNATPTFSFLSQQH